MEPKDDDEDSHHENVMSGISQSDGRRRREDTTIQLRKSRKEEMIRQKRKTALSSNSTPSKGPPPNPEAIHEYAEKLYSDSVAEQIDASRQFRRLLSIEINPPIQQVIDAGIMPRLIQLLQDDANPALQFEACWALTNIASGTAENTRAVIAAGAVDCFVRLLSSLSEEVREQSAWALGNIAGDSVDCRDVVLEAGGLEALYNSFSDSNKVSTTRNSTWTLSNLCRGKPAPDLESLGPCLQLLSQLVHSQDTETIADACWALSYISDGPNDRIQAVIDTGVAPRLVELLSHPHHAVQTPALRAVGNIVTGNDDQTQAIVNLGVLNPLSYLLEHTRRNIRKEACWTVSNITAGTSNQVQAVLRAGVMPRIIELLEAPEFEIQKEAAWAVSNSASCGTPAQITYLVQEGCIPLLCDLLNSHDPKVVIVSLDGLNHILKCGANQAKKENTRNHWAFIVIEAGGLTKIMSLFHHENRVVVKKANTVFDIHFSQLEENEEAAAVNLVPEVSDQGNSFAFGGRNNNNNTNNNSNDGNSQGGGGQFDFR